jgi:hypothetical protein
VVNFQSAKNKKAEICNLIDSTDADVIIGTETWMRPEVNSAEIFPENYKIYRKDRKDGYGGVLIAVKDDIVSEEITVGGDTEVVFTKLTLEGNKTQIVVGALYRPPSSDMSYMESLCEAIKSTTNSHRRAITWLGGDLNLPDINWKTEAVTGNRNLSSINNKFLETIHDCNLIQTVDFPTRSDATLDIFLTNRPTLINKGEPLPGISDHEVVFIDSSLKARRNRPPKRKVHIWKRADTPGLIAGVEDLNIKFHSKFSHSSDIESMWRFISQQLLNLMEKKIPSKLTSSRIQQPWITGDLRRLTRRKRKAFIKARQSQDIKDLERYKKLKKETRKACREAYSNYMKNIVSEDQISNPKKFWGFIKGKRCDNMGVAPLRNSDGITYSDKDMRANILNSQFSSVFNQNENPDTIKDKGPSPYNTMPSINITNTGVYKLLQRLNINKATGPDKISTRLLKTVALQISPTLTTFFQASINQGKIPEEWKTANVVPIYKKGDRSSAANYRPVSLTSVCCKTLEHIICSSIMKHLEQNNILTDAQHGFRKHRSCETQLILTINDLAKNIDDNIQTDVILLDFSKAFDKVPHQRLLHKTRHYGINTDTHNWIRDFLSGRKQKVIVEGATSSSAPVLSGVPQGSVLGPLLFLMYINDLPEYIRSSSVRLFADDCVVYRKIENDRDAQLLQEDLDRLQTWEQHWQMEFHPQKCQLLRVTNKRNIVNANYNIHGHTLENVETAKYLGVSMDKSLTWNQHIADTARKANGVKAFLQRNMNQCPRKTKASCYEHLVRPILEYANTIWDPWTKNNIDKIEAVQRRSARFVLNNYSRHSSVTSMLEELKWPTLEERRARQKVIMMYRIVHHQVAIDPSNFLQLVTTRNRGHSSKFLVPHARTHVLKYSFFPRAIRLWNSLPARIIDCQSLDCFKTAINKTGLISTVS